MLLVDGAGIEPASLHRRASAVFQPFKLAVRCPAGIWRPAGSLTLLFRGSLAAGSPSLGSDPVYLLSSDISISSANLEYIAALAHAIEHSPLATTKKLTRDNWQANVSSPFNISTNGATMCHLSSLTCTFIAFMFLLSNYKIR